MTRACSECLCDDCLNEMDADEMGEDEWPQPTAALARASC